LRPQHAAVAAAAAAATSEGNYGNKLAPGEAGPSASTSRAASAAPQAQPQTLKVTDYLVGHQLDDALAAGQELVISWPFAEGQILDFMQAEALWYVLFFLPSPPVLFVFVSCSPSHQYQPLPTMCDAGVVVVVEHTTGNTSSSQAYSCDASKTNRPSSYPSSPVSPAKPTNAQAKYSSSVST
jgi:hypothetical protein